MSFVKNKNNQDFPMSVLLTYQLLRDKFSYQARVTNLWSMLAYSFGIDRFDVLDPQSYQNNQFYSYLMDKQIDWQQGKDVDFSELADLILDFGEFTKEERLTFEYGNLSEKLWAIFLAICDPNLNNKIK